MNSIITHEIFSFKQESLDNDKKEFLESSNIKLKDHDLIRFEEILSKITLPFTIVLENNYVDKVCRDSYYKYFSSKHSETSRNCKRLAFFSGDIEYEDFYSKNEHKKLQDKFIGFTVIRDLNPGAIGRTLLNPKKLNIPKGCLRTTTFNTVIMGAKLEIEAFPYSSQDTEIMTCAETSVWNLVEYYGTRYPDYKIIYPSDISDFLSKTSSERVLPSRGLEFTQISMLLKDSGFSPRIYFLKGGYDHHSFKRLFHYYVESGIPIIVGIEGKSNGIEIGHAVVCIGHGENNGSKHIDSKNDLIFIDSADFVDKYFIMDDNQTPYELGVFNQITPKFVNPSVNGIIVPLYKRIFLDATDASSHIYEILTDKGFGILQTLQKYTGEGAYSGKDNPLIVRTFLTSSRSFKSNRSVNVNKKLAQIYSNIPLPKFIWIAELSTYDLYNKGKVFGEIIIDATASRHSHDKLITLHYPGSFGYRMPDEHQLVVFDRMKKSYSREMACTYPMYINNLNSI